MEYIASVRDSETKEIILIKREYDTKQEFYSDLRCNGYKVRFITTEEKFDEDCEKYYQMWEKNKRVKKMIYESDKQHAANMNMTVKEYRAWLKSN